MVPQNFHSTVVCLDFENIFPALYVHSLKRYYEKVMMKVVLIYEPVLQGLFEVKLLIKFSLYHEFLNFYWNIVLLISMEHLGL